MEDEIIGWTIMTGNPVDGFTLYGNYDQSLTAAEAANGDAHLDGDWWIAPIYRMDDEVTRTAGITTENLADIMKAEILVDVEGEVVPSTVGSFRDLHDYVDANCYGGLCDGDFAAVLENLCGGFSQFTAFVNKAQGTVDAWIKAGGLVQNLEGN